MKKLIPVLIILVLISCILFKYEEGWGNLYILDWSAEAVYVMDTTYNVTGPLLVTGTSPSAIYIDNEEIFISNSGFGGTPLIQKFNLEGDILDSFVCDDGSSPGGIIADENYIYTALWGSSELLILNRADMTEYKRIDLSDEPYSFFIFKNTLYIGTSGYTDPTRYVYMLNIDDMSIDSIDIGNNPTYFYEFDEDIYISCTGNIFTNLEGSVVKMRNKVIVDEYTPEYNPGKFIIGFNSIITIQSYAENSIAHSSIWCLELETEECNTLVVDSPSEIFEYKNKINIMSSDGTLYVIDIPTLTILDTIELNKTLKPAMIKVYN